MSEQEIEPEDQIHQKESPKSEDGADDGENEQDAPRNIPQMQTKELIQQNFQIESNSDEEVGNGAIKEAIPVGQQPIQKASLKNRLQEELRNQINKTDTRKIVSQAALERKTEAFEQTRSWEHLRSTQTTQHRQILDSVWNRLQKIISASDESMKFLVQVFKSRIEQEEGQYKYISAFQLGKLFKEFDGRIIQSNYPEFSKAIRVLDQSYEKQSEQIKVFVAWMNNQIRERLELEMANFEKQNKDMNINFNKQRKSLNEMEKDILKYFTKYDKLYQNMAVKNKKGKDFLYAELKFKQAAYRLIQAQRELGKWLLNSWSDIVALESQRLELITHSIIDFQIQVVNSYGKCQQVDTVILALQNVKVKMEVQALYSVNNILSKQEMDFIQSEQLQEVPKYFDNFQCPEKHQELAHPLILKQFQVRRDVGTIGKSWQNIGITITVDHYLLIFENKCSKNTKPDCKYPLEGLKLNQKNNMEVEIIFVIPGLVMDSKKKMLIQFTKSDEMEELCYYLETVGQNKFALD